MALPAELSFPLHAQGLGTRNEGTPLLVLSADSRLVRLSTPFLINIALFVNTIEILLIVHEFYFRVEF